MASDGTRGFTGERPGWGEDFHYDEARHLAAYHHAAKLVSGLGEDGCRVLDAGCGEGFGTQTLTTVASAVTGVDYSADALAFCRAHWSSPRLSFRQVDLTRPGDFAETFDLVLSFQVVEHIVDPTPFLEGLRACIAPGGQLMLTTPNRLKTFSENPYHVREYDRDELAELLGRVFSRVEISGMHGNERVKAFDRSREKAVQRILRLDPLGLRHLLPRKVFEWAFARLAVVVRRQARNDSGEQKLVPEDFFVSGTDLDEAVDLVALCRP